MSGCPLCGSDKTSGVSNRDRRGRAVRTHLCEACGMVFNSPMASQQVLLKAYAEDFRRLAPPGAEPDLSHIVRVFARLDRALPGYWPLIKGRSRILDACAGSGEFVYVMKNLGYSVTALEPVPEAAAYCRKTLGLQVETINVADKIFPANTFDLIRLFHLLVHIKEPAGLLRRMREWLRDDGLLYIELPNIEAEAEHKPKGQIFDIGHAHAFNPVTLRLLLRGAGFEEIPETVERHSGTTAGFFRKAEPRPIAPDPENAKRVSDAITRHYAGKPITAKIGRLVEGLAERAADLREHRAHANAHSAAEHFTARIRSRVRPNEKAPRLAEALSQIVDRPGA
ncbi:hypothetical protein BH11PSE2_BH11PSE2_04270 [soil metagenome]